MTTPTKKSSRVKGPQFLIDTDVTAEKDIIDYMDSLANGYKSTALIELIVVGRVFQKLNRPIFDVISAAAKRGEDVSIDQLIQYINVFAAQPVIHAPVSPAPQRATRDPNKSMIQGMGE